MRKLHCFVASCEETVHCFVMSCDEIVHCNVLWGKDSYFVHFSLTQQGCVHVKWWTFDILMLIRTWENVWLSGSLQCAYINIITNVHGVMLFISKVSGDGGGFTTTLLFYLQDGTPPGLGTVTKVSSRFKTSYIEVRWDYGHQNNYRMGVDGCYDLRQAWSEIYKYIGCY